MFAQLEVMSRLYYIVLFLFSLLISPNVLAAEPETCGGISTVLYSNDDIDLMICHGEYTKIDGAKLGEWQNCDDAMIQIRDKKRNQLSLYADCQVTRTKQFKVQGHFLILRHYYTQYPALDDHPLLIETFDLVKHLKKYRFIRTFAPCQKKDIDNAIQQIDSTISKPFDMDTYFDSVYRNFYKLRDCTATDPARILETFRKYEKSEVFDGEVAETLSEVIEEAELIAAAVNQRLR